MVVHRRAGGLDHVHVGPAYALGEPKPHLAVREAAELGLGEGKAELARDPLGQGGIGAACENF